MSLLSLNTIDALSPANGHVLVVGDIWLDHQQLSSPNLAQEFFQSAQSAGLGLALEWATCTNALNFVATADGEPSAPIIANMRRHKDEKIIPIDGFSEYQAHLQNRTEKYLLNASAIVVVDLDLGCIAEPRALNFVAKQRGVPIVAVVGEHALSRYEGFDFIVAATDAGLLAKVANHVASFLAATGQNQ